MTKLELATMLERFLDDSSDGGDDFSAFTEVGAEASLEPYRRRILGAWGDGWTDADEIRSVIRELRIDGAGK
jgi:hypothetical protein